MSRIGEGTRAFERLLDATTAQTIAMTSLLAVQRENVEAVKEAREANVALAGIIERQTVALRSMQAELERAGPRTAKAVEDIKTHVDSATKESDRRLYRWMLLGGVVVFLATAIGGSAVEVLKAWLRLPH